MPGRPHGSRNHSYSVFELFKLQEESSKLLTMLVKLETKLILQPSITVTVLRSSNIIVTVASTLR